jgi:prevent-host-death family protein
MKITSTEFQQNVGRYQDAALVEPVIITRNGRPKTVLISATVFETLTKGRVAERMEDLDEETLEAIAKAEVPAQFAYLDEIDLS